MAKFNLFNKSTWVSNAIDPGKELTNKALGAMGQRIHELRLLKCILA